MKSLLALLLFVTSATVLADDRSATSQERSQFCKAIKAYFVDQSQGEDVRLSLSVSSCRVADVRVYPRSERELSLEARVLVWIGVIPMPVTCMAEMSDGEIVSGSPDCTY